MKNGHARIVRARADTHVESSRGCVYGRRKRTRASLNSKKERRRAIGFLRRRAVCDTDDDERRDDDEMGTFFDARTRIAHFRFEAHARENRATDDASPTHQHRMSPSSASRASLLAFTRVVRETSKKIHARAPSAKTTTLEEGEDKRIHRVPVVNASRERSTVCDIDL